MPATRRTVGSRPQTRRVPKATALGQQLDNKPLWEYIEDATLPNIPSSCQRATFKQLLACDAGRAAAGGAPGGARAVLRGLLEWELHGRRLRGEHEPLRQGSACGSLRPPAHAPFPCVPQFVQTVPANGSSATYIASFRAIFMEDVYAGCSNGSA